MAVFLIGLLVDCIFFEFSGREVRAIWPCCLQLHWASQNLKPNQTNSSHRWHGVSLYFWVSHFSKRFGASWLMRADAFSCNVCFFHYPCHLDNAVEILSSFFQLQGLGDRFIRGGTPFCRIRITQGVFRLRYVRFHWSSAGFWFIAAGMLAITSDFVGSGISESRWGYMDCIFYFTRLRTVGTTNGCMEISSEDSC